MSQQVLQKEYKGNAMQQVQKEQNGKILQQVTNKITLCIIASEVKCSSAEP